MTRLKNRIQSVLHANLIPPYKGTLFSNRGRAWLETLPLAQDQRRVVLRHAGELDRLGADSRMWTRASRRRRSRSLGSSV